MGFSVEKKRNDLRWRGVEPRSRPWKGRMMNRYTTSAVLCKVYYATIYSDMSFLTNNYIGPLNLPWQACSAGIIDPQRRNGI